MMFKRGTRWGTMRKGKRNKEGEVKGGTGDMTSEGEGGKDATVISGIARADGVDARGEKGGGQGKTPTGGQCRSPGTR